MKNSIDREIWRLLWPVLLLTLAQKLGSAFEGILVSVNSSQELAVMGICGPYITIITTVSYGLGIAANAATGRAYADRSWEASHKACVRAFLLLTLYPGLQCLCLQERCSTRPLPGFPICVASATCTCCRIS